jgi:hypothetical protein
MVFIVSLKFDFAEQIKILIIITYHFVWFKQQYMYNQFILPIWISTQFIKSIYFINTHNFIKSFMSNGPKNMGVLFL